MNLVSIRSAATTLTFHAVAEVAGLSSLAAALFLNALPAVGVTLAESLALRAALIVFATGQILAGLACWRRQDPLASVLLTAFGLFWFSRSAFVITTPTAATELSAVFLLLLWGGFALIFACEANPCRRSLRVTLGAVAAALLLQACGEATDSTLLLVVGGSFGLLAALAAGLAAVDRVARLSADLSR